MAHIPQSHFFHIPHFSHQWCEILYCIKLINLLSLFYNLLYYTDHVFSIKFSSLIISSFLDLLGNIYSNISCNYNNIEMTGNHIDYLPYKIISIKLKLLKLLGGEIYLVVSRYTFVCYILHIHHILHFFVPHPKFLEPKWSHETHCFSTFKFFPVYHTNIPFIIKKYSEYIYLLP